MTADILSLVKTANGFEAFNPMQQKALAAPLFDSNVVVAAPTASGKTIVAELCGLDSVLNKRQKAIYVAPLRALAAEHYLDFKRKYAQQQRIRFGLSTGDFDSTSQYLSGYDFIFATVEKLDSLIRHRADWLTGVGLLVVDEIHLLGTDRGPTLEMVITKLRAVNPRIRIVGLSATISNASQIAKWLSAKLVESDYRPVPLSEGVYFDSEIRFANDMISVSSSEREGLKALVHDTVHVQQKQCLVFASTRPLSQSMAQKLSVITENGLSDAQKIRLQKAAKAIRTALEIPSAQCELLASLVARGAAFHNAGLVEKQRRIVESAFKKTSSR